MPRQDNYLSHHEELRYNYLLKNISYLGPSEQEEFNYLDQKKKGYFASQPTYQSENYHAYEEPSATYDDGYQDEWQEYQNSSSYAQQSYEAQDVYYNNVSSYQPQKKVKQRRRQNKRRPPNQEVNYTNQGQATYYADNTSTAATPPPKKPKKRRRFKIRHIFYSLIAIILVVVGFMGYNFFKGYNAVTSGSSNYSPAVKEVFNGEDTEDGTNILVLGSDQRVTQGSTDARTDTIMVVNVGNKDNKIKMVSFMRDTLVNIEGVSSNSTDQDVKLNTAFNIGEQNDHQGAELMRETLKRNFGIKIKYYVMVDFETFAEAINTLFPSGVEIDAQFSTVDGETVTSVDVPDDLSAHDGITPDQTITVGKQRMDGRTLLNYARFRKDDEGDYGRTKRQQQVMQAIMTQIKDPTKLFTGSEAIGKVFGLTSTNMSYAFLLTSAAGIISDAGNGIEQVTMPNNGDWVDTYDIYGGAGLAIDMDKYRAQLQSMGME